MKWLAQLLSHQKKFEDKTLVLSLSVSLVTLKSLYSKESIKLKQEDERKMNMARIFVPSIVYLPYSFISFLQKTRIRIFCPNGSKTKGQNIINELFFPWFHLMRLLNT